MSRDPSALAALAAVQQELTAARAALAERAGTGVQRGTTRNSAMIGRLFGAAALGALAGLLLLLAIIAAATREFVICVVFLLPGLGIAAGAAVLIKAAIRIGRPAMRERQELLDREQQLLQQAAFLGGEKQRAGRLLLRAQPPPAQPPPAQPPSAPGRYPQRPVASPRPMPR